MNVLSSLRLPTNLTSRLGSGSLFQNFSGLFNSSKQHQEAAQTIAQASSESMASFDNSKTNDKAMDKIEISSLARLQATSSVVSSERNETDLEQALIDLNQSGTTYTANAKLIKSTSTIYDALFRAIA